jgi:hypothetical protein
MKKTTKKAKAKQTKTKKKQPKSVSKPKPKPPKPQSGVYSEASRMVELDAERQATELFKRGKGIVPMDALVGIRLFTPVQVWTGLSVPTEPTKEIASLAAYMVRRGMRPEAACRAMGITAPEYQRWVSRGVQEIQAGTVTTPCALFVRALDMADAQDELADIIRISDGEASWGSSAWKRERKHTNGWDKTGVPATQVNIVSGTPQVDVETMIPGAAEVLFHLEQAGYLKGQTIDVKGEEVESNP